MDEIRTHRDLLTWREAMGLVELVYKTTASFPKDETFGLIAQLRRAAVSVASNIAEGAARNSSREFGQFLGIACGSIAELETQLELAVRLGFLRPDSAALQQADRVGCLLRRMRQSIRGTKQ